MSRPRIVTLWITLAVLLGLLTCSVGQVQAAADRRSYVSGNFFLILDNVKCGFLKSIDGGAISAEVISEPVGPSYFVKKHIGQPKYEDFAVQIGFTMAQPFYDWITNSWAQNYARHSGGIVAADYSYQGKSETQFFNALITETTIPACDGSGKDPAYITVKFAPEYTRSASPEDMGEPATFKSDQKSWISSNFKLAIDGLDCNRVSKIDSFTVKQAAITDNIGDARDQQREPGKLEFPNLKISLSESSAQGWYDWHKDFVIKGNNDESKEKNGTLTFFSANMQTELLRIEFYNLGICKISSEKVEANSDSIRRVVAELYCERMVFKNLGKAVGSSEPKVAAMAVR